MIPFGYNGDFFFSIEDIDGLVLYHQVTNIPNAREVSTRISWFRDLMRSCVKTSYRLVNRIPDYVPGVGKKHTSYCCCSTIIRIICKSEIISECIGRFLSRSRLFRSFCRGTVHTWSMKCTSVATTKRPNKRMIKYLTTSVILYHLFHINIVASRFCN